jgi:hypothetical protein
MVAIAGYSRVEGILERMRRWLCAWSDSIHEGCAKKAGVRTLDDDIETGGLE